MQVMGKSPAPAQVHPTLATPDQHKVTGKMPHYRYKEFSANGDADLDSYVDGHDFAFWNSQFGSICSPAASWRQLFSNPSH